MSLDNKFHYTCRILGLVSGPSKNVSRKMLAKCRSGVEIVISNFSLRTSQSLNFFCKAEKVSGLQKRYQSRRLAKSRIYHSTPQILFYIISNINDTVQCTCRLSLLLTGSCTLLRAAIFFNCSMVYFYQGEIFREGFLGSNKHKRCWSK